MIARLVLIPLLALVLTLAGWKPKREAKQEEIRIEEALPPVQRVELSDWTVKQLKAMAKDAGVPGWSRLRKQELVKVLSEVT